MRKTKIEWTEISWNPSIGCTKISDGCKFCYAEKFAKRLHSIGLKEYTDDFKFKIVKERLLEPYKYKKPSKFFVCSMSDLFHEEMPYDYLDNIFEVISNTPYHIYQILTKRDYRLVDYFSSRKVPNNVWLGVTVENSKVKDRIINLKKIDVSIRFVSFEPLIDSVGKIDLDGIHWVIVGGESGINARPIKKVWVEEIYEQSKLANIAFFFKQWGTWGADEIKRNKKANGRLFRNKIWDEFPSFTPIIKTC